MSVRVSATWPDWSASKHIPALCLADAYAARDTYAEALEFAQPCANERVCILAEHDLYGGLPDDSSTKRPSGGQTHYGLR